MIDPKKSLLKILISLDDRNARNRPPALDGENELAATATAATTSFMSFPSFSSAVGTSHSANSGACFGACGGRGHHHLS
jgi:hypothetical protein